MGGVVVVGWVGGRGAGRVSAEPQIPRLHNELGLLVELVVWTLNSKGAERFSRSGFCRVDVLSFAAAVTCGPKPIWPGCPRWGFLCLPSRWHFCRRLPWSGEWFLCTAHRSTFAR